MGNLHHTEPFTRLQYLFASLAMLAALSSGAQTSVIAVSLPDSVRVPASTRYDDASTLRKLFMGANYRRVWGTPVTMPVFNLTQSGLKITELGGGQQTKSLRLEDKDGTEWVLRTVDKEVSGAVPKGLKGTIAQKAVQDLISAAHPYAPLVVGSLAKATGIVAPQPVLYYVPDDPAFGPYQSIFAHQVVYLEKREPTPDGGDTDGTDDVAEKLTQSQKFSVLQKKVLKARLLDMLIADWDRHADQWRWGEIDSAGRTFYYAIPRDRDQAFFMAGGLIPKIGKFVGMHHINWFTKKAKGFNRLNFKSWTFDHTFLNELDAHDWKGITQEFQQQLTDAVIEKAVRRLPPAIYALSGATLEEKLKSRRNTLLNEVMEYYAYISAEVEVKGTEEQEHFDLSQSDTGLVVRVYASGAAGGKGKKLYERSFTDGVTYRLHLVGFGGNDSFSVAEGVRSNIKLYLYGGEGNDTYDLKGKIRSTIYDAREEQNKLVAVNGARLSLK